MGGVGRTGVVAVTAALALSACSSSAGPGAHPGLPSPGASPRTTAAPSPAPSAATPSRRPTVRAQAVSKASLLPFTSCTDLLTRVKREALAQVGPWGLRHGGAVMAVDTRSAAQGAAPAAAAGSDASAGKAFSPTNNQEAGVDEADLVKTDGRVMVVLRQERPGLQVVDVSGATPRLGGFLALPQGMYGGQLLLLGDRAVVVGTRERREGDRYTSATHVLVVSVADPAQPRVQRAFDVAGWTTAVREIGGRVLLVTQSTTDITWVHPENGTRASERAALRENRRRIQASGLRSWLPSVTALRTGRTYHPVCEKGLRTQSASGTGSTTLVSLDPASDVPGTQATVEGSGAVVYASTRSVYVTTWPWKLQAASSPVRDESITTDVHRFDVSDPARPQYRSSGSVPGSLIGQYAMSEHEGDLRVATTLGRTWALQGESAPPSDNLVTVLRESDQRLMEVGQVRGLGRGERIYGVRFMGSLGYVVTFRETDPLYVLDLSDPARPARRGELHVTGYSSYLHPLGAGLLLGIGQEVADNRRVGTQVSTFDVSNARTPRLEHRQVLSGGSSAAEHDPHALLWWPTTRDLVVPLAQYDKADGSQGFVGVVVLHVSADGRLREVGRVSHPEKPATGSGADQLMRSCCWGGIVRSVVVDDALLTLSEQGVLVSSMDSLEDRAWLPYR